MRLQFDPWTTTGFFGVLLCWFVFSAIFLLHKKPGRQPERKRESASILGIVLQGIGYAGAWFFHRPFFTPIVVIPIFASALLALLTIAIAVTSVWLVLWAVQTLGKQWAYVARVVDGHRLVTEGPYASVRNPIYLGMIGMLIATGLAVSHWWALLGAMVLFWAGTIVRIRAEEKLLRETFGAAFEGYARRVPALLPRPF